MRTIGLLGGMSWESTAEYYRIFNEEVRRRLGGQHSARVLLFSVDFQEIETLQHAGRWEEAGEILVDAAGRLKRGGADFLVLATNTMHKLAPRIESAGLELLHIADVAANAAKDRGVTRVALLGTRFTMEHSFYRDRLESHGLQAVIPNENIRGEVHRIIFDELCQGKALEKSRRALLDAIDALKSDGAEAVVLGCTELPLLVSKAGLPLLDTTRLHAVAAVEKALEGK